ncbi:kinase-like domain-containing protein [Lipomyces arxii]|uniref:kinase-like domain-containing protein n=1 Tax=Lipomyces arxii TaxID=56418 RepID=UPI0034CFC1AF
MLQMDDAGPATQQYSASQADLAQSVSTTTNQDPDVVCTLVCLSGNADNVVLRSEQQLDAAGSTVRKHEWLFGRHARCDVVLADIRRVSNTHFRLWMRESKSAKEGTDPLLIEDWSTNGTYLNSTRLPKRKSSILTQGDEIGIGMGVAEDEIRFLVSYGQAHMRGRQSQTKDSVLQNSGIYGRYELCDVIGKGAFATVRKAIERSTGEEFAVKIIPRKRIMAGLAVKREVEILMMVNHPNVVGLKEFYEDRVNVYLVMEYVSGGDLMDYITKHGPMRDGMAKTAVRQVLLAVANVHSLGISHRDIKPDNILVVAGSEEADHTIQVKVSDFGLAKISESGTFLKTFCGTLAYLAPEVIKARDSTSRGLQKSGDKRYYSNAVDMWSVGCLVYVLLTGYLPFNGSTQEQLCSQISLGEYAQSPLDDAKVSKDARAFIAALLQVDSMKRPTATTALLLKWMQNTAPQTAESEAEAAVELVSMVEIKLDDDSSSEIDSTDLQSRTAELKITRRSNDARTSVIGPDPADDINDQVDDPLPAGVRDHENDDLAMPMNMVPPKTWLILRTMANSIPYKDVVLPRDQMWFGRTPQCDVVLPDTRTSKVHCCILRKRNSHGGGDGRNDGLDSFYVCDFSTNGCYVNNQKVGRDNQARLQDGDELAMFREGTDKLAFRIELVRQEEFRSVDRANGVVEIRPTAVQKNEHLARRKRSGGSDEREYKKNKARV